MGSEWFRLVVPPQNQKRVIWREPAHPQVDLEDAGARVQCAIT